MADIDTFRQSLPSGYGNVEHLREYGFTFQDRGYTFTFSTNYKNYVEWTQRSKKSALKNARNLVRCWAHFLAVEAKKRCPQYSGGLTEAIKVSDTHLMGVQYDGDSKVSAAVGVDGRGWKSSYDEVIDRLLGAGKDVANPAKASPSLAIFIHEYWDKVAGTYAQERASVKGAHFGVRVGEHFLTRARTENETELATHINKCFKRPMQMTARRIKHTEIADSLSDTTVEEMVRANEAFSYESAELFDEV